MNFPSIQQQKKVLGALEALYILWRRGGGESFRSVAFLREHNSEPEQQ